MSKPSAKIRALRLIFNRYMRWRIEDVTAPLYPVLLEYSIHPKPRYGTQQPPIDGLVRWLRNNDHEYAGTLDTLKMYRQMLARIPESAVERDQGSPFWSNTYFTGLDAIALYGLLGARKPVRFLEVGSGNSTRFARRAVEDLQLATRITSIDPQPRASIDALCDEIIRSPLEETDLRIFDQLEAGDFLFIDNSHRVFQNSDVTVFFLEVLPRLKPGITVHIHDIFIPYDYPEVWAKRHYSEQYLLAAYVLGGAAHLEPVLPLAYIYGDTGFRSRIDSDWCDEIFHSAFARNRAATGGFPGTSFWCRTC